MSRKNNNNSCQGYLEGTEGNRREERGGYGRGREGRGKNGDFPRGRDIQKLKFWIYALQNEKESSYYIIAFLEIFQERKN